MAKHKWLRIKRISGLTQTVRLARTYPHAFAAALAEYAVQEGVSQSSVLVTLSMEAEPSLRKLVEQKQKELDASK